MNKVDVTTFATEQMTVAGQRVRVGQHHSKSASDQDTVPLLVFSGLGCAIEHLQLFAAAMPGRRIITFDMPGIGGSPAPLLPYRFSSMARLADQIRDALEIERVDVLGFSWGGALAQQYAHDFGERCNRLVLMSTMASTATSFPDSTAMMAVLSDSGVLSMGTPDGNMYQLGAAMGWSSTGWLHKLVQPTLVLRSTDDSVVTADHAALLVNSIADARLHIVRGDHMVLLRAPGETAGAIETFLSAAVAV